MSNMKDFVIENGVLTKYNGNDSAVVIALFIANYRAMPR